MGTRRAIMSKVDGQDNNNNNNNNNNNKRFRRIKPIKLEHCHKNGRHTTHNSKIGESLKKIWESKIMRDQYIRSINSLLVKKKRSCGCRAGI